MLVYREGLIARCVNSWSFYSRIIRVDTLLHDGTDRRCGGVVDAPLIGVIGIIQPTMMTRSSIHLYAIQFHDSFDGKIRDLTILVVKRLEACKGSKTHSDFRS